MNIKIGVSNHHIHLTKEVLEILFGKGYKLTPKRYLTQKGQYACEETVTLKKGKKVLVIDKRPNIGGISILKKLKVLMFISMVPIFFIQTIRRCGNM